MAMSDDEGGGTIPAAVSRGSSDEALRREVGSRGAVAFWVTDEEEEDEVELGPDNPPGVCPTGVGSMDGGRPVCASARVSVRCGWCGYVNHTPVVCVLYVCMVMRYIKGAYLVRTIVL